MWSSCFGLAGMPGMPIIPVVIAVLIGVGVYYMQGGAFGDSLPTRLFIVGILAIIFFFVSRATWDGFASRVIHQTSWVVDRHLGAINTGWFSTLFFLSSLVALAGAVFGAIWPTVDHTKGGTIRKIDDERA